MINIENLKHILRDIEKITDQQNWEESIEERKKVEMEFHDLDRNKKRIESLSHKTYREYYGNRKYYASNILSRNWVKNWIEINAKNKIFLDYACGNGSNAILAAQSGALFAIGIDISAISVKNARKNAYYANMNDKTYFVKADAENTMLPDRSIDMIVCSGVLHHLDLSRAFPELYRILTPGGKILAVEALNYNPIIKLYRYLTPKMRTDWEREHILSLKDVKFAKRFFKVREIRYWHIMSIFTLYLKPMLYLFNCVDSILTKIPIVRLLAWIFTFELIKPTD